MKKKNSGNNDYFIGMVGSNYSVNQKHRYKKRKRSKKRLVNRAVIIAVCVLLVAAVAALVGFVLVPLLSNDSGQGNETKPAVTTQDISSGAAETTVEASRDNTESTAVQTTPVEDNEAHIKPDIKDDGSDATMATGTVCIWNKQAFNLFYSGNTAAKYYANSISDYAKKLSEDITVYNMVVGNHTEFGLPQRVIDAGIETDSQSENIKCISETLSDRVISVDCYNKLAEHCNEYIFFGTDHHWTALGAYYGYEAFCEKVGLTPMDISQSEVYSVEGFLGSLYTATSSTVLAENTDTVYYYSLPNETYAIMNERMGDEDTTVDVYYPGAASGDLTYGLFCWGDTASFVIHSDCKTGRKIALVKDSFANAFAPYLSANYDEVHLIDYRYWEGDLNKYLNDNGIKEVLFLNNTMSANTASQVDSISNVFS